MNDKEKIKEVLRIIEIGLYEIENNRLPTTSYNKESVKVLMNKLKEILEK